MKVFYPYQDAKLVLGIGYLITIQCLNQIANTQNQKPTVEIKNLLGS